MLSHWLMTVQLRTQKYHSTHHTKHTLNHTTPHKIIIPDDTPIISQHPPPPLPTHKINIPHTKPQTKLSYHTHHTRLNHTHAIIIPFRICTINTLTN